MSMEKIISGISSNFRPINSTRLRFLIILPKFKNRFQSLLCCKFLQHLDRYWHPILMMMRCFPFLDILSFLDWIYFFPPNFGSWYWGWSQHPMKSWIKRMCHLAYSYISILYFKIYIILSKSKNLLQISPQIFNGQTSQLLLRTLPNSSGNGAIFYIFLNLFLFCY